jgi:hypothetical protein
MSPFVTACVVYDCVLRVKYEQICHDPLGRMADFKRNLKLIGFEEHKRWILTWLSQR